MSDAAGSGEAPRLVLGVEDRPDTWWRALLFVLVLALMYAMRRRASQECVEIFERTSGFACLVQGIGKALIPRAN